MKKIILTATMAFCTVGLFAQSSGSGSSGSGLMSKKGEMILPEAGDWAISFDASPFLNYFGNFLSGYTGKNTSPTANFLNSASQTIVGKYYVDAQTAYRGTVRIGFNTNSMTHLTTQDNQSASYPPQNATVNDKLTVSNHFIGLGAGMEKRKGKTRLQGYYGAELMFWLAGSGDSTMTYGNSYASSGTSAGTSQTPTYYDWAAGSEANYGLFSGGRTTSDKPGSMFGVSIQGFIGFEYFFMPKISVGAEYTWGINFWSQGEGTMKTEIVYSDASGNPADGTTTMKTGKSSHFGVDTGVNSMFGNAANNIGGANLNIIFHF